nr:MAG TPA: hypothetical protein [Caudoviricetes sp.]
MWYNKDAPKGGREFPPAEDLLFSTFLFFFEFADCKNQDVDFK